MMSDEARQCQDKLHANRALANRLEQEFADDEGWICVVRFYAALHLVNAFLIDKGNVDFDTATAAHLERKKAMQCCPELRDAPQRYRDRKELSESVRYDATFACSDNHRQISRKLLDKIAAIIEPKLKKR